MYKEDKKEAKYFTKGRSCKITEIVLHHWGVDGQSHNGVVSWFSGGRAKTSAHDVVSDGRVTHMVPYEDTAWHAGNWEHNCKSIGIECRPEMSAGDLKTAAELIANIWKKYGKLPIIEHRDIVATACPGRWHKEVLTKMASAIYDGEKATVPKAKPKENINVIAKEVWQGKWGNGEDRKKKLEAKGYNYDEVQAAVNGRLNYVSPEPISQKKSISEIADEVIDGKWGNGSDRVIKLEAAGYNYTQVQDIVNDKLLGKNNTKKSIDRVARDVIKGVYGNNPERKVKLAQEGFNPARVQRRVNEILSAVK